MFFYNKKSKNKKNDLEHDKKLLKNVKNLNNSQAIDSYMKIKVSMTDKYGRIVQEQAYCNDVLFKHAILDFINDNVGIVKLGDKIEIGELIDDDLKERINP